MTTLGPGSTFSHYRIVDTLGHGGQATAFKAEDLRLSRPVVIKALKPELASSETARRRFEREAALCSALDNPHIQARLRRRGDGRPLLHRAPVRGGADPQAVHGRAAPRDALRALDRDPARRRPRRRPRERHRPPRPQARQHHRRAGGPGEDPRLRPRQDARAGRAEGGGATAVEDRRPPDRDRRALRLDGLQLPGAGLGPGRRPPDRRLQPRRRPLRDGHRCRALPGPSRGRGAERGHQRHPAPDRRPQPPGPPRPAADPRPGDGQGAARPLPDDGRLPRRAEGAHAAPHPRDGPRARPRRRRPSSSRSEPAPPWSLSGTLGRVLGRLRPTLPGKEPRSGPAARGRALAPPRLGQREAPHPRRPPLPQPRRQPRRRLLRVLPGGRRHHRARQRQVARRAPLGLRRALRGPERRPPPGRARSWRRAWSSPAASSAPRSACG